MAKDKAPAFQFYPKDFLTDERVRLMSNTEVGIYTKLLCLCWLEGSLPLETDRLARLIAMPLQQFTRLWENSVLRQCFYVAEGRLQHKRLDAEREKQETFRRRQSDNGFRGGRPKKAGKSETAKGLGFENESQSAKGLGFENESQKKLSDLRSPICDLQSAKRESPRPPTVLDGSLPRDHRNHVFCSDDFAICVPAPVHGKFIGPYSRRVGGNRERAHTELLAWYRDVVGKLPPDCVMGDAFRFWQPRFDAAFASAAATPETDVWADVAKKGPSVRP